ncbi:MAG: TraR/DksA C4-type zinc finger protein [Elusimicrobiaceae bacterium]|nr:TraR/DksA C4-type zinc finger protein [Elusimicrobiaceae bacterium]
MKGKKKPVKKPALKPAGKTKKKLISAKPAASKKNPAKKRAQHKAAAKKHAAKPASVKKQAKKKHAAKSDTAKKHTMKKPAAKTAVKHAVKKQAIKNQPAKQSPVRHRAEKTAPKPVIKKAPARLKPVKPAKQHRTVTVSAKPKIPLHFKSMPLPTYHKDEETLAPVIIKTVKPAELTPSELAAVKTTLTAMRDEVLRRIADKKTFDMPDAEVGDPIDVATQNLDKELFFEITDNDHVTVDQIEAALRRIKLGSYGICEGCRCVIPKKRLHAMPFARYCINCQHSNENSTVPEP